MITNPVTETAAVDANATYRATRETLLASASRMATGLDNAASNWARAALVGERAGQTDKESERKAVVAKFPLPLLKNGTVPKTPNGKFKTNWDRYCLVRDVAFGEHKTYDCAESIAAANAFIANDKLTLSETERAIKTAQTDHNKANKPVLTDAEQAEAAAKAEQEQQEQIAAIVAISPGHLIALAERIDRLTTQERADCGSALARLATAIRNQASIAFDEMEAERTAAAAARLAA